MVKVERLKLELKHTLGMFVVAQEEVIKTKITMSLSVYLTLKIVFELNIVYVVVGTR